MEKTSKGKDRKRKAVDKENEWMAEKHARHEREVKAEEAKDQSSSSGARSQEEKEADEKEKQKRVRKMEEQRERDDRDHDKRRRNEELKGKKRERGEEDSTQGIQGSEVLPAPPYKARQGTGDSEFDEDVLELEQLIDESPMEVNILEILEEHTAHKRRATVEYLYDPYEWDVDTFEHAVEDNPNVDYIYFDENSWEHLDSKLVKLGEQEEMNRFKTHGVYEYCTRDEAKNDREGKFVKTKWVRVKKNADTVRCRLVAQELGYGVREDELYAGTPSLSTMKLMLSWFATMFRPEDVIMIVDIKSAFLYGKARCNIYIELPEQDEEYGGNLVGRLVKSMYGTRDAPLIWRALMDEIMLELGFEKSLRQPGVYYHRERGIRAMIHVDDFLIIGNSKDAHWFLDELRSRFEVTSTTIGRDFEKSGKYLNRTIKLTSHGIEVEADNKHVKINVKRVG